MNSTRIVSAVALLAVGVAVGCTKRQPPPAAGTSSVEPAPAPAADPKAEAAAFAQSFLKAVHDGTATPAMLTPEFKKVVAEPVFADDEAKGYSDGAAERWLTGYREKLAAPTVGAHTQSGEVVYFYGTAGAGDPARGKVRFAVRVARAEGGWAVDWLWTEPDETRLREPHPSTPTHGGGPHAQFAADAFLRAIVGREDRLAEGLLTPRYKAALAPPFASDKRGYNRGLLGSKLAEFRGGATGFSVTRVENGAAAGELTAKATKKPFTLKLVKGDRPWDWLVDEFKSE